jgi:hypothetical protein
MTFELQARLAVNYLLEQYKQKELLHKQNNNTRVCFTNYILD